MEDSTEVQSSERYTSTCSYEDLPNHELDNLKQDHEVVIVMVPFPVQGHLNQLLQLACLIASSYDLPVYYVGSATLNRQAQVRANALNPSDIAKIHFHEVPIPEFSSPPPDLSASRKFPLHHKPLWDASLFLREHIASFLRDVSSKSRRIVVVHDPFMSFNVQDVYSLPNAESYIFNGVSAFYSYCFSFLFRGMSIQREDEFLKKLPSLEGEMPDELRDFLAIQGPYMDTRSGSILNTSKVIEGEFLDSLAQVERVKQWAIGPILPTKLDNASNSNNICLKWLNKQPPRSVLCISFGTTTTFSDREVMELAMGLEQSKQKFIWVLREADRGDIFTGEARKLELPEGFEERVKGVGLVMREWVPQPEILAHSSTGGFMSHCGWNSCIESITMGVPIAAWPMHSDQPMNSFLVTEVLKIGLTVREWEKREELVSASTIENVVRKLMASEEGDGIRKRAEELGVSVRRSTEKGGASQIELDSFIAHITR
ncbi:putative zeatin O-glucosyltransferase-like [Capsicum annuum]|uniref:zeatin O-xylosyltransferase n=1 Tax=Capsicum annuum TaxID=4072 RepID=UPI001FB15471|nr:zeatin O-xylosyltransferase [Capsicum annuum]KAF3647239.1 putative zeatin O-glucosyltransferase-like [Capsicum annuum]